MHSRTCVSIHFSPHTPFSNMTTSFPAAAQDPVHNKKQKHHTEGQARRGSKADSRIDEGLNPLAPEVVTLVTRLSLLIPPDRCLSDGQSSTEAGSGFHPSGHPDLSLEAPPYKRNSGNLYTKVLRIPPRSPLLQCFMPASRPGSRQCYSPWQLTRAGCWIKQTKRQKAQRV